LYAFVARNPNPPEVEEKPDEPTVVEVSKTMKRELSIIGPNDI
jgi:hypothetical protein